MVEVVYSRRALNSISAHFAFLSERSPSAAQNLLLEVERTSTLLGEFPKLGRSIEGVKLRCHVTRRFRYRIIYFVTDAQLEIRDVMHPSRNWPR